MRTKHSSLLCFIGLIGFFLSCTKQDITYVQTIAASGNPAITQVDSFSGNFIVYRPDSFATSSSPSLFLGYHEDPVFGKIKSEPYIRFSLPVSGPDITNNPVYDSMALIVYLNPDYYGDTNSVMDISAYRVAEDIQNPVNIFYNNQHFATYPSSLGNAQLRLRPNSGDSIRIKIDNALGRELFNFYLSNAQQVTDTSAFLNYFKGIKLTTDIVSTNAIYSFKNTGFVLRMYYHIDIGQIVNKYIDFTSGNNIYQFYGVAVNRAGSVLQPLDAVKELNATALGNKFYSQELTGIKTSIHFPSIADIPKQATFVKLLKAQLEIKPAGATSGEYPIPSSMYLYLRSIDGSLAGPLLYPGSQSEQAGELVIDNLYAKDTRYLYDVTAYVTYELSTNSFTTRTIVPVPSNNLARIVNGTTGNTQYRTRLIVSTLTYQK